MKRKLDQDINFKLLPPEYQRQTILEQEQKIKNRMNKPVIVRQTTTSLKRMQSCKSPELLKPHMLERPPKPPKQN